jgi:hypothetical protein
MSSSPRSTVGRPRRLTDAQIAEILAWAASRRTTGQKAAELGISRSVLTRVISTGGRFYKQPSPEKRTATLSAARRRRARLRAANWL